MDTIDESGIGWHNGSDAIRRALTEGQVALTDRRARFVGVEAYVEAGGAVTRDLFDGDNGGYLADAALFDRLVQQKLEREAEAVRSEGWGWVMVMSEFDHRAASGMRRVSPQTAEVGAKAQRKIDQLSLEYDELSAVEEVTEAMEARLAQLEAYIEALKGEPVYDPADVRAGGAFVSLGFDGGLRVERGFIRKADEAPAPLRKDGEVNGAAGAGQASTALPEKLVAQLTACRTAALREAVARKPEVAFLSVVHALVAATFYTGSRVSCLDLRVSSAYLASHTPGIDESPLGRAASDRHTGLAASLPEDVEGLRDALQEMPQEPLMALLAHCAALTIDCVMRTGIASSTNLKHGDTLAQAVSLDMTAHWQLTVANYLGQVTKAIIVEAVREGVSEQAATQLADLKKPAMAEAAERLLADMGWLPKVVCLPQRQEANALAA